MLNDAPPEVEIHLLPPGEQLADHLSNIEIIYGGIVKRISQKPNHCDGCISHMQVLKALCFLLSKQAIWY